MLKQLRYLIQSGTRYLPAEGSSNGDAGPTELDAKIVASLTAGSIAKDAFREELARASAIQVGISLDAGQRQEEARELEAVKSLLSLSRVVSSSLDLNAVIDSALGYLYGLPAVDWSALWLLDGDSNYSIVATEGLANTFPCSDSFGLADWARDQVVNSREVLTWSTTSGGPSPFCDEMLDAGIRSVQLLPLARPGGFIGMAAIGSGAPDSFEDDDLARILVGYVDIIAVAIENSRLYEGVHRTAVLEERKRIAREMHDSMSQMLAYVTTQANAIGVLLQGGRPNDAREQAAKLGRAARELADEVRQRVFELHCASEAPAHIWEIFPVYLSSLFANQEVDLRFEGQDQLKESHLEPDAELHLIRIVQEALTNVRTHSRSRHVSVTFEAVNGDLSVTIQDDGVGFDPEIATTNVSQHYGLHSMRERAQIAGGEFAIVSAPGTGTCVTARIPAIHCTGDVEYST